MKKITRSLLALSVILSSCTKEPTFVRNYSQPINASDPCGYQSGSNISWSEGMSDEDCIRQIKSFSDYDARDYLREMKSLKRKHGNEGIQIFLDKYLEGDSTLGMKLESLSWN